MTTNNNDIVNRLAVEKTVEHYALVLGSDIHPDIRADITQDTYLELLQCRNLRDIESRGKVDDYAFAIVKNKIARYYGEECTVQFDDTQYAAPSEESPEGWDG